MIFANIEYLFLLLLLIPYIVWYVMHRKKTEPTMQVKFLSTIISNLLFLTSSLPFSVRDIGLFLFVYPSV